MFSLNVHACKVVNNIDPLMEGRVQIKCDYLMWGFIDNISLLPWARPFESFMGGSMTYGSSCIPEKDSIVWVAFEDETNLKNPFYFSGINLKLLNPAKVFDTTIKPQIPVPPITATYPDMKFTTLKNEITWFASSSSTAKEAGFYHSPTTYVVFDNSGNVTIQATEARILAPIVSAGMTSPASTPLTFANTSPSDQILIQGGDGTGTEPSVLGTQLSTLVGDLTTALTQLVTAATQLALAASTVPTPNPGAVTAAGVAILSATSAISSATSQLPNVLSTKVLHN